MVKKPARYFEGRKCCECKKEETYVTNSGTPLWYGCKCGKENCIGWLCHKCYTRGKSHSPGGYIDTIKSIMNIRIGNVKIDSFQGRYIMSQTVIAKALGVEDLNIKMDNFKWSIDIEHEKYMKIDVKYSSVWNRRGREMWTYAVNRKIDCNTYFLLGFGSDYKNIEDLRIIPNEGWICNLVSITIVRNSLKISKFDQFKVDHEQYNDIYHNLMSYFRDKEYFGIEDIKRWNKNM